MWSISRTTLAIAAVLASSGMMHSAAIAQDQYIVNQNHAGMTLPGISSPHGFDEVRAADGTTCRSAMGGAGAYLDTGVIGGGLNGDSRPLSAYGRIVVPLGEKPRRLNCDRLYQLELERLQLEVQLLKRGLDPRTSQAVSNDASWASGSGWTTGDRK